MLIGRKEEQRKLKEAFESEYSSFVAVYGRRRIGKTFLIRETFDYRFTFQHAGLAEGTRQEQIKDFCASLYKAGMKEIADAGFKYPEDWLEAFYLLETFINRSTEKKKIIFIDELSWMDTPKSGLVTALESFWNGWASARKDILLIVCASATSWMLNNIVHNKGGLYNRLSLQLKLEPFTLYECSEYLKSRNVVLSTHQILECYMIMGGVPYYWSLLEKGYSLPQNIDRLFFAPNGQLKEEFQYLYKALFRKPDKYIAIITALGKKKAGMQRDELVNAAGMEDSGAVTKILTDLVSCGFIKKINEYGKKSRGAYYQLVDNFTLFYFKFMVPAPSDEHYWENQRESAKLNAWRGLAFERVCFEHVPQIKKKLGISGVLTEVNSWSCRSDPENGLFGSQIDMMIVRRDQVINLCEMKFSASEYTITKKDDESIRRKIHDFHEATKCKYAVHATWVTPYGLLNSTYYGNVQAVIIAEDLFVP